MADKTKSGGVRAVRDADRPAGKIGEFRQVRPGTARAIIVTMAGKGVGASIDAIAEATGLDRTGVMAHLFCLSRDCGYGYSISKEKIQLEFPGNRTWHDAIKPESEVSPKRERVKKTRAEKKAA